MRHEPIWTEGLAGPEYPALWHDRDVDVCVVGGGITGVTTALGLKHAGLSVALVEARQIGRGVTGGTTAHLTIVPDERFASLERAFGVDGARLAIEAGRDAIDRIEANATDLAIDCDFERVDGWFFTERAAHASEVDEQLEVAARMGVDCEERSATPLPFPVRKAIRFPDQARVHPLRYLHGLARRIPSLSSSIYERSPVRHIEDGRPCIVTTEGGRVRARHVVLATHTPIGLVLSAQTRLDPHRSYAIAFRVAGPPPEGLFWDTEQPYHYVRRYGDLVIVGGADHKTGHGSRLASRFDELETWARERFPVTRVERRWSAQVYEPADGLPYIGRVPGTEGMWIATGFAGNGMTFGTFAADLLVDLITGNATPYEALFDPARAKPIASARRMVAENVDVAFQLVAGRLAPMEASTVDDVPAGEGRHVRIDGEHRAVYRSPAGQVHVMSPVCTHARCIVQWNDAEKSWDCPCHGGRFTATGEVLDGPPMRALAQDEAAEAHVAAIELGDRDG